MKKKPVTAILVFCLMTVVGATACQRNSSTSETSSNDAKTSNDATTQSRPLEVARIDLGRSVGADSRVTEQADAFTPGETVYATVTTNGTAPTAELRTVWTYQDGQVVEETTRTIAPSGEAVTEFHVTKPAGLPIGKYRVEVFLNGASAATKEFEVKRI